MKIFREKNYDIFHISAQNIDCGYSLEPPRRGGSNEYPQSMFLIRNKKNNAYPCKPQFYYIKVGFKGVKKYRYVFVMLHMYLYILWDCKIYYMCIMDTPVLWIKSCYQIFQYILTENMYFW